tara:strand:- start:5 stop:259 length:255 start_codon:yes stop_codon:yes gene_type:complete
MSTYTEQQKSNLTTEMFAEFLRQHLTKEEQEEYNEMMKRCKGKLIVDVGKVFKEEYLSEDEGIPFEHTSAIREVNEQIKNRLIP